MAVFLIVDVDVRDDKTYAQYRAGVPSTRSLSFFEMLLVAQELESLLIAMGIKLWSSYMCAVDALQTRLAQIPIFKALRLQLGTIGEGTASLTAPYDPAYAGIFSSFHGGLLMTLADTAACVAVLSLAGADAVITTTDMDIRFLAPCRSDARAEARIIKFGKTLCPVSIELHDTNGVRVAIAQVTYMRLGKL